MRVILIPLLFLTITISSFAQSSIYGATGTFFVPSGFTEKEQPNGGQLAHNLRFFSFYKTILNGRLELALSNTFGMISDNGYEMQKMIFPIVPSIKYRLAYKESGIQTWGYSVGAALPFGPYITAGYKLQTPLLAPEVTGGISFRPLDRLYIMGSMILHLSDFNGEILPIAVIVEGAIANSTDILSEREENFYGIGTRIGISKNLNFNLSYRKDPQVYNIIDKSNLDNLIPKEKQNQNGNLFLQISYQFKGFKILEFSGDDQ